MKTTIILFLFAINLYSQEVTELTSNNTSTIILLEKKLNRLSSQMTYDTSATVRKESLYEFIKILKQALDVEGSYLYDFNDSIFFKVLKPEDNSFRIFTFQLEQKDKTFRHFGCIQLNKKNSKLIPLLDFSDTFDITPQTSLTNRNWFGALYYNILTKKIDEKNVYFLFGIDYNDIFSNKKIVEPMVFKSDREVQFGIPVFDIEPTNKSKFKELLNRYVVEYNSKARVMLNYDEEKDKIVYDHLVVQNPKHEGLGFMQVPDGTFEALEWKYNKWVLIPYMKQAPIESNSAIRPIPFDKDNPE